MIFFHDESKVKTISPHVIDIMPSLALRELGRNPPLKFTVIGELRDDLANVKKRTKIA